MDSKKSEGEDQPVRVASVLNDELGAVRKTTAPIMHLKLTLAELTRLIIDLEDTRDGLNDRISAIQERMDSIRVEIKRSA